MCRFVRLTYVRSYDLFYKAYLTCFHLSIFFFLKYLCSVLPSTCLTGEMMELEMDYLHKNTALI